MRRLTTCLSVALAAFPLAACDDDSPPAPGESNSVFDALLSRMGGVIVPTTDEGLFVEIIPEVDGKISALVLDEDGAIQAGGASVQVQVAGNDGSPHPVTLQWDAVAGRYVGQVGEGVDLQTGPMSVTVSRDGSAPAVGQVAMVASAPAPTHGGRVVVAGEYAAEVVPSADGTIHAYVEGPNVGAGASAAVQVEVQGTDGRPHPVVLQYDPQEQHYVGRLGGEVRVAPGPLGFTVIADGRPRRTRVHRVVAVGPQHGGDVVVAGEYAVEVVPSADGSIDAWVVGEDPVEDGAEIIVTVGRERRPVTLVWSADVGHFVGAVDADVRLARAPIGVVVVHGGIRHHGAILPRYTVAVRDTWGVRIRPSAEVRLHGHPHGLYVHPGMGRALGHPMGPMGHIDVHGPSVRVHGMGHLTDHGVVRVRGPSGMIHVRGPSGMIHVRGGGGHVRVGGGHVRGGGGHVRVGGMGMGMN